MSYGPWDSEKDFPPLPKNIVPQNKDPYVLKAQICAGDYNITMTIVPDGQESWRYISEDRLIDCFYNAVHRVNRDITKDRDSHNHLQEMVSKLLAVVYNHDNFSLQQKVRKIMAEYQVNKTS